MTKKRTRDLAEAIDAMDFPFDPAMYILTYIADERVPIEHRLRYSAELIPYLYAKKKDVTVEGAMQGNLTISWMNSVPQLAIEDATDGEE